MATIQITVNGSDRQLDDIDPTTLVFSMGSSPRAEAAHHSGKKTARDFNCVRAVKVTKPAAVEANWIRKMKKRSRTAFPRAVAAVTTAISNVTGKHIHTMPISNEDFQVV